MHKPSRYNYKKGCRCDDCKRLASAAAKQYRALNLEKVRRRKRELLAQKSVNERRDAKLRHYFGITIETYNDMLARQFGRCAICKTTNWGGRWNSPCVDHCHLTGKIRGLLCLLCNRGLGNFRDNVDLLQAASEYLNG